MLELTFDCQQKVTQDPNGSDHLPIEITITNGSNPSETVNMAYDLTRHIDWKKYADSIISTINSVDALPPLEEYNFLSRLIYDSATRAQTKPIPGPIIRRRLPNPWWDNDCTKAYVNKSNKVFRKS